MKLARWIFAIAGVYGLLVLLPMFFTIGKFGQQSPPTVNHAEFYYGFVGSAVVWQLLFLMISFDPRRYRPLMLVGVLEKVSFGAVVIGMWGTLGRDLRAGGTTDLILGGLFLFAWVKTRSRSMHA